MDNNGNPVAPATPAAPAPAAPGGNNGGGGAGGGAGAQAPQPQRNINTRHLPGVTFKKFHGNKDEDIETWINKFDDMCAAINLDDDNKRHVVRFYLESGAETVVRQLLGERAHAIEEHNNAPVVGAPAPLPVTYAEIRDLLRRTFAGPHADRHYRREFHKRRQENSESVRSYGLALQDLVTKAYPQLPPVEQQAEALDRFLQGLHDKYRSQLALREYDNLMTEVRNSQKLESIEEDRRPSRAIAATVSTLSAPVKADRSVEFQQVKQALDEIHSRMVGDPNTVPRPPPSNGTCFNCGEKGHFRRECQQPRTQRQDSQPQARNQRQDEGFGNVNDFRCYECSGIGHMARDCANLRARPRMTGGNSENLRGNGGSDRRYRDRTESGDRRQDRRPRYEDTRDRYDDRRRDYSRDRRFRSQDRDREYRPRMRPDSRERQGQYREERAPERGVAQPASSRATPPHAANALYEATHRSEPTLSLPVPTFAIPANGAWGVREGNQVTFNVGDSPQPSHGVNMIMSGTEGREPGEDNALGKHGTESNGNTKQEEATETQSHPHAKGMTFQGTNGNGVAQWQLVLVLSLAVCLQTVGASQGINPLLCEAARGGFSWQVPESYECSVSAEDFKDPAMYQTMEVHSQNIWLYKSKAYICTKYRHIFMQKNWLFRDNRVVNETVLKTPVAGEECRKWVKSKMTEWGPLTQSHSHPEVWAISQPLDRSWGRFMIDCCRWLTTEAWGASVHETQVSMRHSDPFPVSPLADLTHCSYLKGECSLPSGEMVFWKPNKTEECVIKPWRTLNGTRYKALWISHNENFAFSFRRGQERKVKCGEYLSLSDQGVWVKEGPRQAMPYKRFDAAMNATFQRMKNSPRSKREEPRGAAEGQISVVSDRILASRLQAMSWYVDRTLQAAFLVNAKAVCSLAKTTFINTRAQLMTNPTAVVRQLLGHKALIATYAGGIVQASPCVELPEGTFFFLRPKACFGTAVPVKYQVAGRNHTGYMNTITNVISSKAVMTGCEGGRAHYVELRNTSFWLLSNGEKVLGNRTQLPQLPSMLSQFNLTLHYNHTTFTNFLMYDMEIFRPAISVSEYIKATAGTQEVSHLMRIQREKDQWEKKNGQLEIPGGLFSWPHISTAEILGIGTVILATLAACVCCRFSWCSCRSWRRGDSDTGYEDTPRRPNRVRRRRPRLLQRVGLRLHRNPLSNLGTPEQSDGEERQEERPHERPARRRLDQWSYTDSVSPPEQAAEYLEQEGGQEVDDHYMSWQEDDPTMGPASSTPIPIPSQPLVATVAPLPPWAPVIHIIPPSEAGSREELAMEGRNARGEVPLDSARRARRNTQHSSVHIAALQRAGGGAKAPLPFLETHCRGIECQMVWDTGATHSFVTRALADAILAEPPRPDELVAEETPVVPHLRVGTCAGFVQITSCVDALLRLGPKGPRVWARLFGDARGRHPRTGHSTDGFTDNHQLPRRDNHNAAPYGADSIPVAVRKPVGSIGTAAAQDLPREPRSRGRKGRSVHANDGPISVPLSAPQQRGRSGDPRAWGDDDGRQP